MMMKYESQGLAKYDETGCDHQTGCLADVAVERRTSELLVNINSQQNMPPRLPLLRLFSGANCSLCDVSQFHLGVVLSIGTESLGFARLPKRSWPRLDSP